MAKTNYNNHQFVTELDGFQVGQTVNYSYERQVYRGKIEQLKIVSETNWALCQNAVDPKQFHWTPTRLLQDCRAVAPEEAKKQIADSKKQKTNNAIKPEQKTISNDDFSLYI